MLRTVILAALALVCVTSIAEARPRHVAHQKYDPACNVSMPCEGVGKPVVSAKEAHRRARGQQLYDAMPFGMPTDRAGRAVNWVKPRAWCGWWMRKHLGVSNPAGNLARWWAGYGTNAHGPAVGTIVVWRHHVGKITGRTADGQWIVKSGNDGHAVRERPRSVANAIAFRWPA